MTHLWEHVKIAVAWAATSNLSLWFIVLLACLLVIIVIWREKH